MSKELWLLRHGKSDRNSLIDDFDRPLKKRGKRSARRVGNWMKLQGLIPDIVISSPALRALATAKIVCAAIGVQEQNIQQDRRLYAEGFQRLLTVLAANSANADIILLVGHNPELEDLLIYLVGAANVPDSNKLLPTAALARLIIPNDLAALDHGCAELLPITYAKSLSEDGIDKTAGSVSSLRKPSRD
jgi:phosphohistidine phosphatase